MKTNRDGFYVAGSFASRDKDLIERKASKKRLTVELRISGTTTPDDLQEFSWLGKAEEKPRFMTDEEWETFVKKVNSERAFVTDSCDLITVKASTPEERTNLAEQSERSEHFDGMFG